MSPEYILKNFFGFDKFRLSQKEIIDSIIAGNNVLAVLPTGGGKSLCYQIPALLTESLSIVISPLIALMKDQVDSINKKEKVAAYINSTLSHKEIQAVINDIYKKKIKILYLSPEKLDNIQFAETIKSLNPYYLFVDEAHCISEWGHNFRPSYRKIKLFAEYIGIKHISAFTATATEEVRKDIIEQLGLHNAKVFVAGFERNNFYLNVIKTKDKKETILKLISSDSIPAIIYTATRKLAEELFENLKLHKFNCTFYHAGLNSTVRRIIQDDFLEGRINLIIATKAFGMGIDKSDIRTVIHYNLPSNIENYYQEIGRAGRDGNPAYIYLLFDENDISIQEYFIKNSFPTKTQIETVYNAICDYGRVALNSKSDTQIPIDNNLLSFLISKGINKTLLDSSIKILEDSNYLKILPEFLQKHSAQILPDAKKLNLIVNKINNNELKNIILFLTREYGDKIFRNKVNLNLLHLSEILNCEIEVLINYLELLSDAGILLYEQPSKFTTVSLTKERIKSEYLQLDLTKTEVLYNHYKNKLHEMINYVNSNDCRFSFILRYFGESIDNYKCGKCDNCTGQNNTIFSQDYLKNHIITTLEITKRKITKKELIEILKGKNIKYQNFPSYGTCIHYSSKEIESALDILKEEEKIFINNELIIPKSTNSKLFDIDNNSNINYEEQLELFNRLRQIRKEASEKFNQPVQIICPDETLRLISKIRPKTFSELINIDGFNKRMFNKVGEEFLRAIKEFENCKKIKNKIEEKNLSLSSYQILELIQKKYSLEEIASLTKLPESIISIQIEILLEAIPQLEINSLFEKGELEKIYKKIDEGYFDLKELRKALDEKISYAKLRIALAKRRVS
ncbi:MAG: RecQ family ATP-dependent DNA helicase [Melioribacter sp.]|nr:RecQ family ATP-dependent DNA helicase [Melioribacter sp.]